MRASKYSLLEMGDMSRCPAGHSVSLLASTGQRRLPSFFLCFTCGFVGQVGVGPVRREVTDGRDRGSNQ